MGYICIDTLFVKYLYLKTLFGCMVWKVVTGNLNGLPYMPAYMPSHNLAKFMEPQHTRRFTREGTLVRFKRSHFMRGLNILRCKWKHHSKAR